MNRLHMYMGELIVSALQNKKETEIPEDIDVNELVKLASRHQMFYLVLATIINCHNDEKDKAMFRESIMMYVRKNIIQINEITYLENELEERGIEHQFMKGSVLKKIYPMSTMRDMGDIDLLVEESKMEEFASILIEREYSKIAEEHHHDVFYKRPHLMIEVHKTMFGDDVDKRQNEYFSIKHNIENKSGKIYAKAFSIEDFYIYMVSHIAKHFYQKGCGVRNLVDIYVYRKKYDMDEDYVLRELKKCGIDEFAKHMEKMTRIWLCGEESNKFYDELFCYMIDGNIYGKDENGIWSRYSKSNGNANNKIQMMLFYCFPPYKYMVDEYLWLKKIPIVLPIAWVIRAISGIIKGKGKDKRELINTLDKDKIESMSNIYGAMKLNFVRK